MKNSILSICCLLILHIGLRAQVKIETLVTTGSQLIYEVESDHKKYDFIVTIKKLTPNVEFDWEMTSPVNTKGTIVHTTSAMKSGNTMFNYFKSGTTTLDNKTLSVWLSLKALKGLNDASKGTMLKMNTDAEPLKMGTYTGALNMDILIDGKLEMIEKEIVCELTKEGSPTMGDVNFAFYNSTKLPIIVQMNNGFYLHLKEIKTK